MCYEIQNQKYPKEPQNALKLTNCNEVQNKKNIFKEAHKILKLTSSQNLLHRNNILAKMLTLLSQNYANPNLIRKK